ncbi:MAG: hypothetical protein ACK56I_14995, partial [bacterium]
VKSGKLRRPLVRNDFDLELIDDPYRGNLEGLGEDFIGLSDRNHDVARHHLALKFYIECDRFGVGRGILGWMVVDRVIVYEMNSYAISGRLVFWPQQGDLETFKAGGPGRVQPWGLGIDDLHRGIAASGILAVVDEFGFQVEG